LAATKNAAFDRLGPLSGARPRKGFMSETRKLAALLVADVVGYGRMTGADEELTLWRQQTLCSDLIRMAQAEAFLAAHVK